MSSLSHKFAWLIAFALLTANAVAAEWSVQPSIETEVGYDSNIVLGSVIEEEVEIVKIRPQLNLRGKGATWQADFDLDLPFNFLSNDLYDSDDQIARISLNQAGERQGWGLDGEFRRESTRTAAPELGFVVAATRTERRSVRPSWTRILNEKNSLQLSANWLEAEYDTVRFSDYEYYGYDATWVRQLDERLTLQLGLYSTSFETGTAPLNSESDTVGLTTGLTRQFDERLSGTISIGARRVDTTTRTLFFFFPVTVEDESDGFTGTADIAYRGEIWNGSLSVSRDLRPDAFAGELLESDRVRAKYSRQLRPNIYFDFALDLYKDDSLDGSFDREHWYATPALRWRLAERWTFTTTLRHRIRDASQGISTADAEGTAIFFRFRYLHPRTSW